MEFRSAHRRHAHGGKPPGLSGTTGSSPTRTSLRVPHVRPESRDTRSVIRTSSCPFAMTRSIAIYEVGQKGQAGYPTWVTSPTVDKSSDP